MKKWIYNFLLILFAVLFLVSTFMVIRYFFNSQKQKNQFNELANMVSSVQSPRPSIPQATEPADPDDSQPTEPAEPTEPVVTEPGILPEFLEVSGLNADMAAWIQIEGTKINYPVMHTPDRPEYYLNRDFYGEYSASGCLFAREECDINTPSDNITIYGHNMNDGSMFHGLMDYRTKSFWESHRYIYFDTLTERHTYEIFAVFKTTATKGQGFTYHHFINAGDQAEFDEYIQDCKELSLYDTGITPVYGDKLITLSTCEYSQINGRLVVVAKRVV